MTQAASPQTAKPVSAPVLARTMDVDGHEFGPPHLWSDIFGPAGARIAEISAPFMARMGDDYMLQPWMTSDSTPMTLENVWNMRSSASPGAFDMHRRLEAMDLMGIERQLIFPSFGLLGDILAAAGTGGGAVAQVQAALMGDMSVSDARALGLAVVDEYNDWAVRTTAIDPDRLRAVGMLGTPGTLDELMSRARDLTDRGLRAVLLNIGAPPAGVSPAHPDLDPFWALLAERNVPVCAHLGSDLGFVSSSQWSQAPAFKAGKAGFEVGLEPYSYATMHLAISHWLATIVMGGVFERHPTLRFGAIELGGHWLGPLATALDMWATKVFARRLEPFLSMKPSAYIARNVRVTPFNIIEPVEEYFVTYPHLASSYCYATDYPHIEGGKEAKARSAARLEPLGETVMEQYFSENAKLLFP